jgi:membrane fusion protein, multidrug efflux system
MQSTTARPSATSIKEISVRQIIRKRNAATKRLDRMLPPRILLTGLAVVSCLGAASAQKAAPAGTEEIRAQIVPLHSAILSSEMAGRIDGIASRAGDRFKKGDVLVTFDCAIPRAQLGRAQAVVTQAARTFEINRRAVEQKSTGQLELDIAAAEVLKAKADLAIAEAVVSRCTITAPFAGVTVAQKAHEFEYAAPGQPLLDVLDDHALEIELNAPTRWLGALRPGAAFQVRIDETGKMYSGRISRLGARVDPTTQSVKAIGDISGDASDLMTGMNGRVSLAP